jgi:hypothetical protein
MKPTPIPSTETPAHLSIGRGSGNGSPAGNGSSDSNALFARYLEVVDRALDRNRDRFPYKQILDVGEQVSDEATVAVGIYEERLDEPHDWFVVELKGGHLFLERHGRAEAGLTCKIRESHLEEVVEHPDQYIESPCRLDLDWFRQTTGIG